MSEDRKALLDYCERIKNASGSDEARLHANLVLGMFAELADIFKRFTQQNIEVATLKSSLAKATAILKRCLAEIDWSDPAWGNTLHADLGNFLKECEK